MALESGREGQKSTAIGQIARQSRIPIESVAVSELETLARSDIRKATDREYALWQKYVIRHGDDRRSLRNAQMLAQRSEVVLEAESIGPASYGVSLPSYLRGLRNYRESLGNTEKADLPHKALLVGALTADTLREYDTAVRTVFPHAETNVVDLSLMDPDEIPAEINSFTQGDALAMDFADGLFDTLHTNYLLPALKDEQGRDVAEKRRKFFTEAYRVLNDKGALMMVEAGDPTVMADELRAVGFTDVKIAPNQRFKNRNLMEDFLADPSREPDSNSLEFSEKAYCITASKT